jgi:hypothetical protein
VSESWELPEIWEFSEKDLPEGVFPNVELLDLHFKRRPVNSEFGSRSIWPRNFPLTFRKSRFDPGTCFAGSVGIASIKANVLRLPSLFGTMPFGCHDLLILLLRDSAPLKALSNLVHGMRFCLFSFIPIHGTSSISPRRNAQDAFESLAKRRVRFVAN